MLPQPASLAGKNSVAARRLRPMSSARPCSISSASASSPAPLVTKTTKCAASTAPANVSRPDTARSGLGGRRARPATPQAYLPCRLRRRQAGWRRRRSVVTRRADAEREQSPRTAAGEVGPGCGEFGDQRPVRSGDVAHHDQHVGAAARLARGDGQPASAGEQRRRRGQRGTVDMVIGGADPLGERNCGTRTMNIRVETENRAPARLQDLGSVFRCAPDMRLPAADPCNRHSLRYFLVPAATVDELVRAVNPLAQADIASRFSARSFWKTRSWSGPPM